VKIIARKEKLTKMIFLHSTYIIAVLVQLVPYSISNTENQGGEIISGLPCVKRLNQLYCGSAGKSYPAKSIDKFIDDNKALLRRMYGELQEPKTITTVRVVRTFKKSSTTSRFRRDVLEGTLEEMLDDDDDEENNMFARDDGNGTQSERVKRQADFPGTPANKDTSGKEDVCQSQVEIVTPYWASNSNGTPANKDTSGKEDVCQSQVEIVTPYWASNSNGKVRAVLNNKEFEQAIHQEICSKSSTTRCSRDCSCEQKYKWHRLLAYDPNNDCSGIFMDWFLFPSCCVCR